MLWTVNQALQYVAIVLAPLNRGHLDETRLTDIIDVSRRQLGYPITSIVFIAAAQSNALNL
jgi:hypothetical protein